MTSEGHNTSVEELSSLLELEREALLQGNLIALTEMLPNKEALITDLNAHGQNDLHALRLLDRNLRRNQLLLEGTMDGIRGAATRMADLQRTHEGLETYGSDGVRHNIKVRKDHSVERRA